MRCQWVKFEHDLTKLSIVWYHLGVEDARAASYSIRGVCMATDSILNVRLHAESV